MSPLSNSMSKHIEKKVGKILQRDIPLVKRPYEVIGMRVGISEKETIDIVRNLKERGFIRKVGAIVRHHKAGYGINAMVVWAVPEEGVEEVGQKLASFQAVSHCYERSPAFEGKYTIFSMMHTGEGDLDLLIDEISREIGIDDFLILATEEEFKKSSMEYF